MRRPKQIKPKPYQDDLTAVIRADGKKPVKLAAWRYYSIVDALRWMGLDHVQAHDVAKRCGRTHEKLSFQVNETITIELIKERRKNDSTDANQPG